ncbi:MAG: succinate dehydrogenase, cytochrome b556 subunit [Cytophagales bacterium]|nr:succinate dehydrogenase, cytochrome b556 subunit [Cytophagales bacterium]
MGKPVIQGARAPAAQNHRTKGYIAFWIHRISGLLLALFMPFHFLALAQALQGETALEGFIRWTDAGIFKFAEWGLVILLAAHLVGGMRLLLIEFGTWQGLRNGWVVAMLAASLLVGLAMGALLIYS